MAKLRLRFSLKDIKYVNYFIKAIKPSSKPKLASCDRVLERKEALLNPNSHSHKHTHTHIVGRDLHAATRVNDPGCGAAFIAVVLGLKAAINTVRLSPPELCLQHYAHYLPFTESSWRHQETP